MDDDPDRGQQDHDIAPQAPVVEIFQIGLKTADQILTAMGRAPETAHLRQAGQAGLAGVTVVIARVDMPEELIPASEPSAWGAARRRSFRREGH